MEFAWILFLVIIGGFYAPLFKRLYRMWKRRQQIKRTHGPLLGVIYPQTKNKEEN